MNKIRKKQFKVVIVSSNMNSFGLRGMILIGRDGEAWQVGANSLHVKPQGMVLRVPVVGNRGRELSSMGFEIPEQLPHAPVEVVTEVWQRRQHSGAI